MMIIANIINMSAYYWSVADSLHPIHAEGAQANTTDSGLNTALEYTNYVFTWLFLIEMGLKHLALGCTQYWTDGWNCIDGWVALSSLIGFFVEVVAKDSVKISVIRALRATRVVRIVRLLRQGYMAGCLRLLQCLYTTLPALANVAALLGLVLFIYTTLGMAFFGEIPINPVENPAIWASYPYKMYNQHCNFRYFHTGFLMLFRMSTGESWNGIMHDVMAVYPNSW